jgi:pimeloyl-ACP methyl ester carboxylesterase
MPSIFASLHGRVYLCVVLCLATAGFVLAATPLFLAPGAPATAAQVSELRVSHRAGQTFLTWRELPLPSVVPSPTVAWLTETRASLGRNGKNGYRIYRSNSRIQSVAGLMPIAEVLPLSGWNIDLYGRYPGGAKAVRYVVEEAGEPLAQGLGLFVHNPKAEGAAFYAVTAVVGGRENSLIAADNSSGAPTDESVGQGLPVLQSVERPPAFFYEDGHPTLNRYVRWEAPPNSNVEGRAYDYLVAVPANRPKLAPVGLHLHQWGANLFGGFGWWFNASKGAVLISSNQTPYDWWTGYHERLNGKLTPEEWRRGIVRPYTQRRLLSFLSWAAERFNLDTTRTFVAGSSMGGAGALMLAIRYPKQVAWAVSWVGVHRPLKSPRFRSSYELVYGAPELDVKFEDGTPAWDYYDDVWFLRQNPGTEIGLLTFSNGKNDTGIGWEQSVDFFRALQDTRRPHVFVWGQQGHGQRAMMPGNLPQGPAAGQRSMPLDLRTDQSLPAFSRCRLDDAPGDGSQSSGDPEGQVNLFLLWDTKDLVDEPQLWELTVRLAATAPVRSTQVDITPRRCQRFRVAPRESVSWSNVEAGRVVQQGEVVADEWGLVTLPQVVVTKAGNRVRIRAR